MRDAVIVEAVRTPVGRVRGQFRNVHPADLSAHVLGSLAERTGLDPVSIDDVLWGCVSQAGEQAGNIGRSAVLGAGWPDSVPATTVDRQCGSSQQSVEFAAALVMSGLRDVVVAGGVESMSRVPMGSARMDVESPFGAGVEARYGVTKFSQGWGADEIARRGGIPRERLDAFSQQSHVRAAEATDSGRFDREIVATDGHSKEGLAIRATADEGIRRTTTREALAGLNAAFGDDGLHTAGSSSQMSDGAAAMLIMTSERAAELGLRPLVRIHSSAVVGVDPVTMLTGPAPATARVLRNAGLSLADIGTFEINEAFASIVLSWIDETGADERRTNPDGGAIALGHPLGGSGARLMTTLVHRMVADGTRYGLQSMCEGGGMANATILELIE
ncbi:acetyl-CoA acetyltransferase [Microbacterium sp. Root61]|uniref:thiolase family protein n=1 Tax=Microbacterium sp. Root61 TaxID=1736570 RepID=UPI0006FEBADC|nr:thiolase family protein [Microbacterium sp. Root61]KRA25253.1 acetyl-CoA acetyltransferase [Microbacterium sp. Root61]